MLFRFAPMMNRTRLFPLVLTCLLGLLCLFPAKTVQAEVFYGMDIGGTAIYSVDTISGGPATMVLDIVPDMGGTSGVTLATRPSDNMLFWLDSMGANPNLWRWDPNNPSLPPVLVGTPGATTTNVIRLGFDGNNILYASNGGAGGSLWVLDQNNAAIISVKTLSGATTTAGRGDLCLQPATGTVYVVDDTSLYSIIPATGVTTKVATITGAAGGGFTGCAFDGRNRLVVSVNASTSTTALYQVNTLTGAATALSSTPGTGFAFGDLSTAPNRSADLRLSQSASSLTPGNTVSFTITVTNDGPDKSFDVRVKDTWPAGLTFVSSSASQGTYTSGTGIWQIGALASGASVTLTINANVTSTGAKTNTAQISYSDMADPDSTPNNSVAGEDDQASVTVTPSVDLQIVKTATSLFSVGNNATYSLTVNNAQGSAATAGTYTVTDTLNANLTYVSATGTGWTCGFSSPLLTCTNSTAIVVGGSASAITVTVLPLAGASPSVNNSAAVSGGGEPVANSSNNSSTITTAVCANGTGCPDLQLVKSGPASFTVPVNGTYVLSAKNTGGYATVAAYTITDPLPNGMTIATVPSGTGWTCTPNAPDNVVGGTRVVCSSNTVIAAGGTNPNSISVTVAVTNNAVPSAVNIASISGGGEPSGATGNNSTTLTIPVNDFDLTVTKVKATPAGNFAVPVPPATSTTGSYTITVSNIGGRATPATTYTVIDTLPTGLTYSSFSGTNWACGAVGQVVTCTRTVSIAVGASAPAITLNVTVGALAAPTAVNNISVSHPDEASAYTGNNTASVTTPVDAPDLIVTKSHNGDFTVGTNGVYTITVHNIGAQDTSGTITVTDTLPTGLGYVSEAGANWSCSAVGQVVTCTNTTVLNADASSDALPITVSVNAPAVPGGINTVSVSGGNEPLGNRNNNNASDPTNVHALLPLIAKSFSPNGVSPLVYPGDTSTLTLTITNPAGNDRALTGLAVTDLFPPGMWVAATPALNISPSCGSVTVTSGNNQGDTSLSLSGGGPLAIGGVCTIKVDVVATIRGANNNTTGPISSANGGTGGTASATLTISDPGAPVLTMVSSPDPVGVNQNATLTFRITNKASATADMGFTDNLPTYVVASVPGVVSTCTSTAPPYLITATAGSSTIAVAGVDLSGRATCTVSVNVTSATPGSYLNSNSNIPPALLQGSLTANVNDTLNVRGTTLTKAFAPSTINAYSTSTLTFTITNGVGNPYQSGLAFTDTLPAGLTIASPPVVSQCNGTTIAAVGGGSIGLTGGSLALGQASCTVAVNVTASLAATYVNDAAKITSISAGMTNSVNASLVVNPLAKATIAKGFAPGTIDVYQPSLMTFTLDNANSITLNNANFTDTLSGFYVRSATIGGTCVGVSNAPVLVAGATALNLSVPSLPPGGCTITIPVTGSAPGGPYNNTTSGVTATETGGTAGAVSNTATLTINRLPLQLTKVSSSGATVNPGGTINYSIGYSNINATTPFQNVVITDPLPPFTTYLSASCGPLPATLTSCAIAAPTVGATGTVTWTLAGTLDASSSGNVYLSVQVQ